MENLTAIHFQLASGILGKCVWIFQLLFKQNVAFPGGSVVKNPFANAGDMGLVPESGRSGEGNGTPTFLPGKSYGQRSLVGCSP